MWYLIDTKKRTCLERGDNVDIAWYLKRYFEEFALVTTVEIEMLTKSELNHLLETCGEWRSPKGIEQIYRIAHDHELEKYGIEVQNEK